MTLPRVMTPGMVADLWFCSERHVRNLIASGELPSFRAGGKLIRVFGADVEAYECRNNGGSPDSETASLSPSSKTKRGEEIAEWLSRHPEVERYAIVDDDSDMLPEQMPFFVQTSADTGGLKKRHADRLIKLLAA